MTIQSHSYYDRCHPYFQIHTLAPTHDAQPSLRGPVTDLLFVFLFLLSAEEDVPQASAVSNQIDHLWAKRANEMRNNLVVLAGEHEFFYVDITSLSVGSMELNTVRPFFIESASQLYTLNSLRTTVAGGDHASTQNDFTQSQPTRPRGDDGAPMSKQFRSETQSSQ